MYVGEYIVNVWKFFLDCLSRFNDAVSNVTVRSTYISVNEVSCLRYSDALWICRLAWRINSLKFCIQIV